MRTMRISKIGTGILPMSHESRGNPTDVSRPISMFSDDTEIDSATKPGCLTQLESNDLCKVKQYL